MISGETSMGGFNSGSVRRSHRLRSDELRRISVKEVLPWIRQRATEAGPPPFLTLIGETREVTRLAFAEIPNLPYGFGNPTIQIPLTTTQPNYGGTKFWFVCPRSSCRRRCAVLYREADTNVRAFACRRCLGFRYESQVLGRADTVAWQLARPLRHVLRSDGTVARPRYMHRKTYDRLTRQIEPLWGVLRGACPAYKMFTATLEDLDRRIHANNARQLAKWKREAAQAARSSANETS